MIFNFKKLSKLQKLGGLFAILGAVISSIYSYYTTQTILFSFFSALVLFSLITIVIDRKKDWLDVAAYLIPFLYFFYQNTQIDFTDKHILFIISSQLFSLVFLYLYYGEDLFMYFWNKNRFGIKTYWENLPNSEVYRLSWALKIFIPLLFIFHSLLAVSYFKNNGVLFIHNSLICLLVILIFFHFYTDKLKNITLWARCYFHLGLILFIFDSILEEIRFLSGENITIFIIINLMFLYYAFRPRITP